VTEVVVTTSTERRDDVIARKCKRWGVRCFRGPENDVLKRYWSAALNANADFVVRVTGDCPFIDPITIDMAVDKALRTDAWYCSNVLDRTFPDGLDVEVFPMRALNWAQAYTPKESLQREHVTEPVFMAPNRTIEHIYHDQDLSKLKWCIDTHADLWWAQSRIHKRAKELPTFAEMKKWKPNDSR